MPKLSDRALVSEQGHQINCRNKLTLLAPPSCSFFGRGFERIRWQSSQDLFVSMGGRHRQQVVIIESIRIANRFNSLFLKHFSEVSSIYRTVVFSTRPSGARSRKRSEDSLTPRCKGRSSQRTMKPCSCEALFYSWLLLRQKV